MRPRKSPQAAQGLPDPRSLVGFLPAQPVQTRGSSGGTGSRSRAPSDGSPLSPLSPGSAGRSSVWPPSEFLLQLPLPVRPFLLGFHSVPRIPLMTNVPFPLALIPNPSSSSVPSRRSPVPMPRGCRSPTYNSIKVPSLPPSAFLSLARSPSGRCPPSQLAAGNARPAAQLSVPFPIPLS